MAKSDRKQRFFRHPAGTPQQLAAEAHEALIGACALTARWLDVRATGAVVHPMDAELDRTPLSADELAGIEQLLKAADQMVGQAYSDMEQAEEGSGDWELLQVSVLCSGLGEMLRRCAMADDEESLTPSGGAAALQLIIAARDRIERSPTYQGEHRAALRKAA